LNGRVSSGELVLLTSTLATVDLPVTLSETPASVSPAGNHVNVTLDRARVGLLVRWTLARLRGKH